MALPKEIFGYTVVRFTLEPADDGTRLTLDQDGYPEGADTVGCHDTWHDHLSEGWGMFYFEPIAGHFAAR